MGGPAPSLQASLPERTDVNGRRSGLTFACPGRDRPGASASTAMRFASPSEDLAASGAQ